MKTARSHFKRVILNKCYSRIRSFSLNVKQNKMKKALQITIELPQVEVKHWLLSPRLFILVRMLCPENLNILVCGDQTWGFNFTLSPSNGPRSYPACWQLPIQARCLAMKKNSHVTDSMDWNNKQPSVPRYPCAVHTSHHSQSASPHSLTNVCSCFTNPNPQKMGVTSLWCSPSVLQASLSNSSLVLFLSLLQLLTQGWRFITACLILFLWFFLQIQLSQISHYENKFSQAWLYLKAKLFGKFE